MARRNRQLDIDVTPNVTKDTHVTTLFGNSIDYSLEVAEVGLSGKVDAIFNGWNLFAFLAADDRKRPAKSLEII